MQRSLSRFILSALCAFALGIVPLRAVAGDRPDPVGERDDVANELSRHYRGKTIAIRGVTGFIGTALLAKTLSSLPDTGRIYLLIRPKRGEPVEQRLHDLLGSDAFHELRRIHGQGFEAWAKNRLVAVDDTRPLKDLPKVDLIINCAADIRFHAPADVALRSNALDAQRVAQWANRSDATLIHLSTAYVAGPADRPVTEEIASGASPAQRKLTSASANRYLRALDRRATEIHRMEGISEGDRRQRLIEAGRQLARETGFNDVYTLTKALGERLILRERSSGGRTAIVRPSIVERALQEPAPGWAGQKVAMTEPLVRAAASGKLTRLPADPETRLDIVPVDYVVNAILAAGMRAAERPHIDVYHVAGSVNDRSPRIRDLARDVEQAFGLSRGGEGSELRLKFTTLDKFRRRMRIQRGLAAIGGLVSPRARSMAHQAGQIGQYVEVYAPYLRQSPEFLTDKTQELFRSLSPVDKRRFGFDLASYDPGRHWREVQLPALRRQLRMEAATRSPPSRHPSKARAAPAQTGARRAR